MSVREQIANEWVEDIDVVIMANDMILDSYFSKIKSERAMEDQQKNKESGKAGPVGCSATKTTTNNNMEEASIVFDRTATNLINDKSRFATKASSPFRRANFDLLYTLCTQASIHRILRREHNIMIEAGEEEMDANFAFFKDFYTDRAADFFDGDLNYGRADDFLDELLQCTPAVMSTKDGKVGFIDPQGTAEKIIRMRNKVALEWKELMRQVPDDHIRVRQAVLSKQVKRSEDSNTEVHDDPSTFQ